MARGGGREENNRDTVLGKNPTLPDLVNHVHVRLNLTAMGDHQSVLSREQTFAWFFNKDHSSCDIKHGLERTKTGSRETSWRDLEHSSKRG